MTEREQRELKTLLDRARIAHGRPLSNAETNSVKKYIDKLMAQREAEAKKARQVKKQQAYKRIRKRPFPGRRIRRPAAGVNALSFYVPAG
jgi:histidinol dehydrogenase